MASISECYTWFSIDGALPLAFQVSKKSSNIFLFHNTPYIWSILITNCILKKRNYVFLRCQLNRKQLFGLWTSSNRKLFDTYTWLSVFLYAWKQLVEGEWVRYSNIIKFYNTSFWICWSLHSLPKNPPRCLMIMSAYLYCTPSTIKSWQQRLSENIVILHEVRKWTANTIEVSIRNAVKPFIWSEYERYRSLLNASEIQCKRRSQQRINAKVMLRRQQQ